MHTYLTGPVDKLFTAPFTNEPMVRRHVFLYGGITIFLALSGMEGQQFILVVNLYNTFRVYNLNTLAYMFVGHAVIVLVFTEVDMTVFMNGSSGLPLDFITLFRQWFQGLFLYFFEQRISGVLAPPKRHGIVLFKLF